MLRLSPWRPPHRPLAAQTFVATGARKGRVALLAGCVNDLLMPEINAATISVLTRHGIEVVLPDGAGCCGSLVHHMGRETEALAQARANIDAWSAVEGLDAILINTSGCGTTVKDYGFMLRLDPAYAARAARISSLTKDISEYLAGSAAAGRPHGAAACCCLSLRLLAAARPAHHPTAEGAFDQARLRGEGGAGRSSVLRLGGDLQHSAARHRKTVARA